MVADHGGHRRVVRNPGDAGDHCCGTRGQQGRNDAERLVAGPDSPVVSVGAGTSGADHEPYSNHWPWVRQWRPGTHVSLMPLAAEGKDSNGYAVWSGTSFSAAIYAGELAQERADERNASAGSLPILGPQH